MGKGTVTNYLLRTHFTSCCSAEASRGSHRRCSRSRFPLRVRTRILCQPLFTIIARKSHHRKLGTNLSQIQPWLPPFLAKRALATKVVFGDVAVAADSDGGQRRWRFGSNSNSNSHRIFITISISFISSSIITISRSSRRRSNRRLRGRLINFAKPRRARQALKKRGAASVG